MKKLIFGIIATVLLSVNGHSQKVGEIKDGKFVITENLSFLKEKWETLLKENKIDGEIERFEITSETYKEETTENEVAYFQITGYTKDGSVKVATEVFLRGSSLSLSFEAASSCVCNGCTYGCHPRLLNGVAWCCIDGCSECVKTETASK